MIKNIRISVLFAAASIVFREIGIDQPEQGGDLDEVDLYGGLGALGVSAIISRSTGKA